MGITSLHRMHWISIALVLGLVLGWASDAADSGIWGADVAGHGLLLPDQEAFENGLVQEFHGMRLFRDAVVYPRRLADRGGKEQRVYLVSGWFCDGQEHLREGKPVAEWVRRCVITPTPYRPRLAGRDPSIAAEYPSVAEFLQAMHRAHGVDYRYAWWAAHPVLAWLGGALVLIGGVWPTLINLIAFGRLTRPPQAKALSLWKVRSRKGAPVGPAPGSFALPPDTESHEGVSPPDPAAVDESPKPPVVVLSGGAIDAATESPPESKEFGADRDDFYPTERRRARGFSLVELLTVIGIVAVLVAVLFPALRVARESANRAKCAAQLRQIGVAFQLYANANGGWLPAWSSGWKTWPPGQPEDTPGPAFTIELIPYLGANPDSPVYNCPSFPERYRTYFIEALWAYVNGHDATKLGSISRSSEFVLSGDITQIRAYPYPLGDNGHSTIDADFSDEYGPMLVFPDQGGFLMHRGGDNVLFADSHVDAFDAFHPARITFHPKQMRSWDQVRSGGPD